MSKTINKPQLRHLIAQGKTKKALAHLVAVADNFDEDARNEILQFSARWQESERRERLELDSDDERRLTRQRIANSLLQWLDLQENTAGFDTPTPPASRWRTLLTAFAATIAVLAGIAELTGYSLRDWSGCNTPPIVTDTLAQTQPIDTTKAAPIPPKDPITEPHPTVNPPTEKTKKTKPKALPAPFAIDLKTDRGRSPIHLSEGETMRLYVQATQACKLRILYRLADQQIVLLENDRSLSAQETNQWIEIGDGFEAAAPFGKETLYVFAQKTNFPPLETKTQDGYIFVLDRLPTALRQSRGLKKKQAFTEATLNLITQPKTIQ